MTSIHMRDKMSDYLLSFRHDPLAISTSELGMHDIDTSVVKNCDSMNRSSPSTRRNNNKKRGIDSIDSGSSEMTKPVANMCSALSKGGNMVEKSAPKANDFIVENITMYDLYKLIS